MGLQVVPESAQSITNRSGYDNQPYFINNEQLVFTTKAKNGSSDIILYNFSSKKFTNMTRTPDFSEFSPALTACGQYISAVRVEADGNQRLWLYPINMGEPELLYDDIMPVGYYGWFEDIAALYVVGEPNKLLFPYGKTDLQPIAYNVGRSIQARPKTKTIAYIDQNNPTNTASGTSYTLKAFDTQKRVLITLGTTLEGSSDFIWLDKNRIIMAKGKDLYMNQLNKSKGWEKFASVSLPGYGSISRLALSPKKDKLVLVMERMVN
ncbi:MAG: hypothetical protein GC137_07670 [Alphaproteobacteria bacterium]|nr:hypothetical protein [Alphaproteobacteria bacterium]